MFYLPIQKVENISPKISSDVTWPVISSKAFCANRRSSATNSIAPWFEKLFFAALKWFKQFFKQFICLSLAEKTPSPKSERNNASICCFKTSRPIFFLTETLKIEKSSAAVDEVVKRANNNVLGLASYIYTNNMEKAHKASELMETGTVAVNTPVVAIAEAPFGGIKQTGYGREGGSMAIKDYLNVKYTHLGIKG